MKIVKNYIHLYLGCEAIITDVRNDAPDEPWAAIGSRITIDTMFLHYISEGKISVKIILRELNDMTEEENKEMVATQEKIIFKGYNLLVDSGETCRYLLSKYFDLFGLIESDNAFDKTLLK